MIQDTRLSGITLTNLLAFIKYKAGVNKDRAARELGTVYPHMHRYWEQQSRYGALAPSYTLLFNIIEERLTNENGRADKLRKYLQIPEDYAGCTYAKLKELICNVLNERCANYGVNSDPGSDSHLGKLITRSSHAFIKECMNSGRKIKGISMAFHSGWFFTGNHDSKRLILELNEREIPLRIMTNPARTIQAIADTMRRQADELLYGDFDAYLGEWNTLISNCPHHQFRVCELPIFRKIVIIEFEDEVIAQYRDYLYGCGIDESDPYIAIEGGDLLDHFKDEYDFLFEKSITYDEWHEKNK